MTEIFLYTTKSNKKSFVVDLRLVDPMVPGVFRWTTFPILNNPYRPDGVYELPVHKSLGLISELTPYYLYT